jgi:PAS domain S-box-containing protein
MFSHFNKESDYLLLCIGAAVLFGFLHRWIWRGRRNGLTPHLTWVLAVVVLGCGWLFVEDSARLERQQMEQIVTGYAPTYAEEMGRLGHQEITSKTSPTDPHYWQLMADEKRWLAANPAAGNIYTLRKLPDGRIVRVVDSKPGNQNGTRMGEPYVGNATEHIDSVLAGKAIFVDEPFEDRGGSWVSAIVPLHDFQGNVEAVLGVDFPAANWLAAIAHARRTAIGVVAIILLIIAAGSAWLAHHNLADDLQTQLRDKEEITLQRKRLETLVNSIDGIVWEANAQTFEIVFVSQQTERILGYLPADWTTARDFWKQKLHAEDQWVLERRAQMVAKKVPYHLEYRLVAADARTVWIRESAAVMFGAAGEALLLHGVFQDITEQKQAAVELEQAHQALLETSRHSGMAEVATGVLHNVGNGLNSVNVASNMVTERIRTSKVIELNKVAALLTLHNADFAGFIARDPRGKHIPELISIVAKALQAEHADLVEEVSTITKNIEHIKEIVAMQQSFAKGRGMIEPLDIQRLVDDAIKINAVSLERHKIAVIQAYEEVPKVMADRHMVLQILVNLLRNSKQAMTSSTQESCRIIVRIQNNGGEFAKVSVEDNGIGIAPENLNRIFAHGFTTKKTGNGFGLHSSALAAAEMGGSVSVHSDGLETGATFTLKLPLVKSPDA